LGSAAALDEAEERDEDDDDMARRGEVERAERAAAVWFDW